MSASELAIKRQNMSWKNEIEKLIRLKYKKSPGPILSCKIDVSAASIKQIKMSKLKSTVRNSITKKIVHISNG